MGFSRLIIRYAIAVAVVALLVVGSMIATRPTGLHLTRAELRTEDRLGYQPPSETIEVAQLPPNPVEVSLPHAKVPSLRSALQSDPDRTETRITWYRVVLPGPVLPAEAGYLYVPRWKSDGTLAVYVNGRLQYQSHANLQWNGSDRPLRIAFDVTTADTPIREIAIRLQHVRGIGGALSSLWIGSFDEVGPAFLLRDFLQAELPFLASAIFVAGGVFALFVWFRRREPLYLLFFTMSVASLLRSMHSYLGQERLPISDEWFGWITVNSVLWVVATMHFFLVALHRQRAPLISAVVSLATLLHAIATLPLFSDAFDPTLVAPISYPAMFVLANLVGLWNLRASWRVRSVEALALAGWLMVSAYFGIVDMLLQSNRLDLEGYFLVPYVHLAMVVAFFHTIVVRYTGAVREVERANVVLAERLAEREAELVANHDRLRAVEQRELLAQERQRLMEDMHDGLGSSLVSALRMIEHGQQDATGLKQVLQGCIDDLKLTIDSMEPVETDLLLLLGTLRYRLQPRFESTGLRLRWEVADVPPLGWLDQRHTLHILRILQETFTNIIKHSGATEVVLRTRVGAEAVTIEVSDNGVGFDPALAKTGRGLANQARRAGAIGGATAVQSGPGGTTFQLTLPMQRG